MNSGTASLRYHSIRATVFIAMLAREGRRIGGISSTKSLLWPGNTLLAMSPTPNRTPATAPSQTNVPHVLSPASMPRMTPSCAEQGTPRASNKVVSTRSLRVARMRVVMVAMVSQPRPSTMGSTALPLRPMSLNTRLRTTASRGR